MSQGKRIERVFWYTTFTEALKKNCGVIAHACTKAGVSPQAYYEYRYQDPKFAAIVDGIKERICLPVLEDIAQARAMKDDNRLLVYMLRVLGGPKWNKDKIEDAHAKAQRRIVEEESRQVPAEEQRLPSKAALIAAAAYVKALKEEDRKVMDAREDLEE